MSEEVIKFIENEVNTLYFVKDSLRADIQKLIEMKEKGIVNELFYYQRLGEKAGTILSLDEAIKMKNEQIQRILK